MEENYAEALTEVNEVLRYTDFALTSKIPDSFKQYILDNMSKTYKFTISKDDMADDVISNLKAEAKSILGLIYRNYLCSPEEKAYLLELEKEAILAEEAETSSNETVNFKTSDITLNELFPDKTESISKVQETSKIEEINLIETKEKWYIVLLEKLLNKLKGLN